MLPVTHPFILLPSTQKTKMTMLDSVKSRGMALAAGSLSLLVLCALCVHMSSSQNQVSEHGSDMRCDRC